MWLCGVLLGLEMCLPCSLVTTFDSNTQIKKYKPKETLCCTITPTEYFVINFNKFNRWPNVLGRTTFSQAPPVSLTHLRETKLQIENLMQTLLLLKQKHLTQMLIELKTKCVTQLQHPKRKNRPRLQDLQ